MFGLYFELIVGIWHVCKTLHCFTWHVMLFYLGFAFLVHVVSLSTFILSQSNLLGLYESMYVINVMSLILLWNIHLSFVVDAILVYQTIMQNKTLLAYVTWHWKYFSPIVCVLSGVVVIFCYLIQAWILFIKDNHSFYPYYVYF